MSFFRGLFIVVVMLSIALISAEVFAAVPLTLTHQGRLLGADDQPVDGFFDITYRIYEAPAGGVPLWGEVHPSVHVVDGLFSAVLGSTFPLSADVLGSGGGGGGGGSARYLEITVGATTMSPRSPLSSAPSAISAGHLSGDIETLPNLIVIGDLLTDNHSTFGDRLKAGLETAGSSLSRGATSITNDCDGTTASQVMEKKGLNAVNVKLARTISSPPGGLLALDALDMDSDDDGVMDRSVSSGLDATSARSTWKGGMSGSTTGTIRMMASPDSAVSTLDHDSDGDGIPESSIKQSSQSHATTFKATSSGGNGNLVFAWDLGSDLVKGGIRLQADVDGDGVMDNTSSDSVGTGGVSRRLEVHNIGSSGQDGVSVDLRCSPDSAAESTELCRNGAIVSADYKRHTPFHNSHKSSFFDVFTELSIEDVCDSAGASRRLKSHNLGSSGNDGVEIQLATSSKRGFFDVTASQNSQSLRCSSSADSAAATTLLEADLDGDGVPDNTFTQTCDATGLKQLLAGTTSVAGSSRSASLEVAASPGGGASFKGQITQNSQSLRCSSGADSAAATTLLEADLDGDGVMDNTSADSVGAGGALRRLAVHNLGSSGEDGVEVQMRARPKGGLIKVTASQNSQSLRCSSSADSAAATTLLEADTDGDGVAEQSVQQSVSSTAAILQLAGKKGYDYYMVRSDNAASLVMRDSTKDTTIFVDGDGRIGIGKPADAVKRIDVAGGAYCDGTNWVNASDVNSKENFSPVDGNELLEQIAQLSITRWNYKGNNQTEHIGPTAQDFRAAFGVGADDKSISTIDPSGIALAAIKALNNKMQELNAKTSQLEDQAREITQLKAELDAIKAMLQKQAETKN